MDKRSASTFPQRVAYPPYHQTTKQMNSPLHDAKQTLTELPDAVQRTEAMRLLAEIEQTEQEMLQRVEDFERKWGDSLSKPENPKFWRIVTWLVIFLGSYAAYLGVMAVTTEEFCAISHSGMTHCSHGLKAQIQGLSVVLVGLLLLLMPLPASRWRTVLLWIFWLLLFCTILMPVFGEFIGD